VADDEPPSDTSDTEHRDVAHVSEEPEASATGLSWDVSQVADVAHTSTPNGNGWRHDQPLVPCAACGIGTTNRAPPVAPSTSPAPTPSCPTTPTARQNTDGRRSRASWRHQGSASALAGALVG
jgi:hypothetical protein